MNTSGKCAKDRGQSQPRAVSSGRRSSYPVLGRDNPSDY